LDKVQREVQLFLEVPKFLITQCRMVEGNLHDKSQLNLSTHFNTILVCDRQDGQTGTTGP